MSSRPIFINPVSSPPGPTHTLRCSRTIPSPSEPAKSISRQGTLSSGCQVLDQVLCRGELAVGYTRSVQGRRGRPQDSLAAVFEAVHAETRPGGSMICSHVAMCRPRYEPCGVPESV